MKYSGMFLLTMMATVFCAQARGHELLRISQEQNCLNVRLRLTARFGELSAIKDIVQEGADIHAVDRMGSSALHYAGSGGNCAVGIISSLTEILAPLCKKNCITSERSIFLA